MKYINCFVIILLIFAYTPSGLCQFLSTEDYIKKQPYAVFYWKDGLKYYDSRPVFKVVMFKSDPVTLPDQYRYLFLKSWPSDSGYAYFYYVPLSDSVDKHIKFIDPGTYTINYQITSTRFARNQIEQELIIHNINSYCCNMAEYQVLNAKTPDYGLAMRVVGTLGNVAIGYLFQVLSQDSSDKAYAKTDKAWSKIFYAIGAITVPAHIVEYISFRKKKNRIHSIERTLIQQSKEVESATDLNNP